MEVRHLGKDAGRGNGGDSEKKTLVSDNDQAKSAQRKIVQGIIYK